MSMSNRGKSYGQGLPILALALLALIGCSGSEQPAPAEPLQEETAAATETTLTPEAIEAALASFDRIDGTEDKVVSRCPGCGLAMPGSAEHAMHVADYELHFCSDTCKTGFSENTEELIMALKLPEE